MQAQSAESIAQHLRVCLRQGHAFSSTNLGTVEATADSVPSTSYLADDDVSPWCTKSGFPVLLPHTLQIAVEAVRASTA